MNKLLGLVGYSGISPEGFKYAVNDLPFVHDELLKAVSYGGKTNEDMLSYFERAKSDCLNIFRSEIMNNLSKNAKYSDTLLRFPEGVLTRNTTPIDLKAGQTIQQIYDLSRVTQYGINKLGGIVIYMRGMYKMRISVRQDFQGIIKGDNIYTNEVENLTSSSDYLSCIQVDLSDILPQAINSKTQDQLVVELQIFNDCQVMPQTFSRIEPTIENQNSLFDVSGGFSQGFSDGFSVAKGLQLPDTLPVLSLTESAVMFNVDLFISKNADRLAYCFAYRVASRLLADKITGRNLNIFTNTDLEVTQEHRDSAERLLAAEYKTVCNTLLNNVQSSANPPIVLEGTVGYELGGYLGNDTIRSDSYYGSDLDNAYYGLKIG